MTILSDQFTISHILSYSPSCTSALGSPENQARMSSVEATGMLSGNFWVVVCNWASREGENKVLLSAVDIDGWASSYTLTSIRELTSPGGCKGKSLHNSKVIQSGVVLWSKETESRLLKRHVSSYVLVEGPASGLLGSTFGSLVKKEVNFLRGMAGCFWLLWRCSELTMC